MAPLPRPATPPAPRPLVAHVTGIRWLSHPLFVHCQVEWHTIVDNFAAKLSLIPHNKTAKMMRKGATFSPGDRYGTLKAGLQYRVRLLDGSDFIVEISVSL